MYLTGMPAGESIDGKQWIENGDFEKVEDGVTVGHSFNGNVVVDNTDTYQGNNALKMNGSSDVWVSMPVYNMVSGGTFRFTFWYKGELTNGSVSMVADLYGRNDHNDDAYRETFNVGSVVPSGEWKQYSAYMVVPKNVVSADVKLGFTEGSGTIYVDDVQMLLVSGPELATMLPDQVFYYAGEYETGKAITTFYKGYHAEETCEIDYQLLDGNVVLAEQKNVPIVDDEAMFEFDMDLLTKEQYEYTIRATVRNKGSEAPRQIFTDKVYVYDRPLALNENGEFMDGDFDENGEYITNGEIFTPVIGFEVPGTRGSEQGKLTVETLEKLMAGGINTILYYPPTLGYRVVDYEKTIEELDLIDSYGMKALVLCYWDMEPSGSDKNLQSLPEFVENLMLHPAIYAWYSADEPFSHDADSGRVRTQLIKGYKMFRNIDPVHPVYYTEDNAPFYGQSDHFADIVSIDPYSGAAADYETRVGNRGTEVVEAIENVRPVNNILQAFTFAGSRPTGLQLRNMIYQAYLSGSRTIAYWAICQSRDPVDLYDSEDLWPIIDSFNADEYDIVREQYANGQGVFMEQSREDNAWYDLWEADDVYYLVVTNRTKADTTINVAFDGDIEELALVTEYNVDGVVLTETVDGFSVALPASQAVLVKITPATVIPCQHVRTAILYAKPATATSEGYSGDYCCLDCNSVLERGYVIPKLSGGEPSDDEETPDVPAPKFDFSDIPITGWYYNEVKQAFEMGLMEGIGNGKFDPTGKATRAQIWTIIARMYGVDVESDGLWYEKAMNWAYNVGITDGSNPNSEVTREQLVAMLYRFAKYIGEDVSVSSDTSLASFKDADMVSAYAVEAMLWAVDRGVIKGSNGNLNPRGTAIRAEIAAIFVRYKGK